MSGSCEWCEGAGCEQCAGAVAVDEKGWEEDGGKDAGDDWGDFKDMADDAPELPALNRAVSYTFLADKDIFERKDALTRECTEKLGVTPGEADRILRAYLWNVTKAEEDWFHDRNKTRSKIGVHPPLEEGAGKGVKEVQCQTSMCDKVPVKDAIALGCGHWFCKSCWQGYLESQVMGGQDCIYAVCPGFSCTKKKCKHQTEDGCKCQELVPEAMVYELVQDRALLDRYTKLLRDAFLEKNKTLRWCPRSGCTNVVEYRKGGKRDITCKCGHRFCFSCSLDSHSPVPCDLAQRFLSLDSSDALTEALIKAITKPCPKCNVLIQKNEACIHMTCMKCRHEFCWLCKKAWQGHGGGYYSCKQYNEEKASGKLSEEQQQIIDNQKHMQKYSLYRESYNAHKKSVQANVAKVKEVEQATSLDANKTKFLVDSLQHLADGHRLLQWSYCLTYFLKEGKEKKLFLFQQDVLQKICKEFHDFVTSKNVEVLCQLDVRERILNWGRTVENSRKGMLNALDEGDIIEVIMNQADDANDSWACTKCASVMEDKEQFCSKCQACRLHGEKPCWGCKPQ